MWVYLSVVVGSFAGKAVTWADRARDNDDSREDRLDSMSIVCRCSDSQLESYVGMNVLFDRDISVRSRRVQGTEENGDGDGERERERSGE